MTDPRHPLPQLDLFTSCAIHACEIPVAEPGDVCTGCLNAFGHLLQPRPTTLRPPRQLAPGHSADGSQRPTPDAHAGAVEQRANQR
ncbi:hypothetical protein ACFTWF_22480 [Rhodococcus sp. NPDC056960]|uniref:hypothetical protein n=1 Tax=Rhodococcus sp. NPDC056960 TaxID=3345982 RepID=UPI003630CE4B